jgi:nitroimidazol reductase NimA-like FMN-containing flavoprotein (pyridoxamine 5'-phosphate oxidase superfamily)
MASEPATELDVRFSSPGATATPWRDAVAHLERAAVFWLSTVRPEGRPHVTPLLAVWVDGALYFCTGADERKARNLAGNARCVLTTGTNTMNEGGLDMIVEGEAVQVSDEGRLRRVADAYEAKYGSDWRFDVRDGAFNGAEGNRALVFEVAPLAAFGFGKGPVFSQTRWRFR